MATHTPIDTATRTTIRAFLALPAEAMPSADWLSSSTTDINGRPYTPSSREAWEALRIVVGRDHDVPPAESWYAGQIILRADRDEWRNGVVVTLTRGRLVADEPAECIGSLD